MNSIEFLFGGSFDPVHYGHINVISGLRGLCPDWSIRLLPCAVPALKGITQASFEQRVSMLQLATRSMGNVFIDERENKREGTSYTLDSLQELLGEKGGTQCFTSCLLVVGADTLNSMKYWHQWQQLSSYCHLLVVNRPGTSLSGITREMKTLGFSEEKNIEQLRLSLSGHYYCLMLEEKDISSTRIRHQLENGLSVDKFIPDCVSEYIKKKIIYQKE